jgi:hypothetical protein
MKKPVLLAVALAASANLALAQETPVEFGRVAWERQLEPALDVATKTGKPVWLQFQEVPG